MQDDDDISDSTEAIIEKNKNSGNSSFQDELSYDEDGQPLIPKINKKKGRRKKKIPKLSNKKVKEKRKNKKKT